MISSASLSNVKYYVVKVEFQVRGSPYLYSFIWVLNPPNITDNIEIYKKFEDYAISGNIPSETDDHAILFAFVQTYETH